MANNTIKRELEIQQQPVRTFMLMRSINWVRIAPVLLFAIIAIALGIGLTMNPREIPSVLIGSPVPIFDLPPVKGRDDRLSSDNLTGQISLVNVFASWCAECRTEHPFLMSISKKNLIPIHGLNYKDNPDDAQKWLNTLGDPFTRTGADRNGSVAMDWGVYGVPETFLVDETGEIIFKHIGALTQDTFEEKILPIIQNREANKLATNQ